MTSADHKSLFAIPGTGLAIIIGIGVATTVTFAAIILCMWQIIDLLVKGQSSPDGLYGWILGLTAAMLLNAALRAIEFNITEAIGFRMVQRLRNAIYGHMSGMSPNQIQHRSRGSLLLRLTGDLSMLRTWISRGIGRGIISLFIVACGLAILAYMNILLVLIVVWMFFLSTIGSRLLGKTLQRRTARVRRRRSVLTSNVDEQISTLAVIQVSGRSGGEAARFSKQNEVLTEALLKETTIRGWLRAISTGGGWLAIAALIALGSIEIMAGRMNIATLIAAITVVRHMAGPVRSLGFSHDYWRRAQISRKKITDFLNSSSRILADPGADRLSVRKGRIDLDQIMIKGVLKPFSATINAGEHVAVMGPNSSGKSIILSLIARLHEPDEGMICIDGTSLAACSLKSTFRHIGMVSNDLPLMRGTIYRNLTYRKPFASKEEIQRVILTCQLDIMLADFPEGLETWITEGGKNLSAGHRQRLVLARALLGNPPILLLDEPFAHLDATAKEILTKMLSRYDGTVLIATHAPQDAELAHQVWDIQPGGEINVMSGDQYRQMNLTNKTADLSHLRIVS